MKHLLESPAIAPVVVGFIELSPLSPLFFSGGGKRETEEDRKTDLSYSMIILPNNRDIHDANNYFIQVTFTFHSTFQ